MSDLYFLIFGIILSLISVFILTINIYTLFKCNIKINGKISKINKKKIIFKGTYHYQYNPSVTYVYNKKSYTINAPFSSRKEKKFIVGNELVLFINDKNPNLCRFKNRLLGFIIGLLLLCFGLLFIILNFI